MMRTLLLSAFSAVVLSVALSAAADISGIWTIDFDPDFGGNPGSNDCTFKQNEAKLTVRCGSALSTSAEVKDRTVTWEMKTGPHGEIIATFSAEVDDDGQAMIGTWHLPERDGKFTAQKQ